MNNNFFRRWDDWFCRKTDPHALAILRICFGLFLFIEALTYLPGIAELFSNQGLVFSLWADGLPLALRPLLEPPAPALALALFALYCLAALTLAAGIAMRTSLVTLILLYLYYWQLSFHEFPSSYHRLFFVTLVVLLFSGADKTLSLRMKLRHGSFFASEQVSILPQRILALQITATYVGVGWQKMWLPDWQSGTVLFLSFIGKWGTPVGFFLGRHLPTLFFDALVWLTKLFEFFLPFWLWMPSWRRIGVLTGTIFHVAVALTMSIWWFLILPPAYVLFYEPSEVKQWLARKSIATSAQS